MKLMMITMITMMMKLMMVMYLYVCIHAYNINNCIDIDHLPKFISAHDHMTEHRWCRAVVSEGHALGPYTVTASGKAQTHTLCVTSRAPYPIGHHAQAAVFS